MFGQYYRRWEQETETPDHAYGIVKRLLADLINRASGLRAGIHCMRSEDGDLYVENFLNQVDAFCHDAEEARARGVRLRLFYADGDGRVDADCGTPEEEIERLGGALVGPEFWFGRGSCSMSELRAVFGKGAEERLKTYRANQAKKGRAA